MNELDRQFTHALVRTPQTLHASAHLLWQPILKQLQELITQSSTTESLIQQNINHLPRLFACSEFCGRILQRNPALLLQVTPTLPATGAFKPPAVLELCRQFIENCSDETHFMQALRRFRQQKMFIIAWNDLCLSAGLAQTMEDLSELADACLHVALEYAQQQISSRFEPVQDQHGNVQQLIILGLGKLGGKELNFSSDVDLILAYPEENTGSRPATAGYHEYFTRIARKLVRYLDEVTAEGFVFRVDLRLRPNGGSGPLVLSTDAMEHYYEGHGRDWERYALIKARPVAGDLVAGQQLLTTLKPFIYRRYLDFGAIESIRDMKALIERQLKQRGLKHNIKLGPGGIREIEFITQSLQLVHGGRNPVLQTPSLYQAIHSLVNSDHLHAETAAQLLDNYQTLRDTEHRLQMFRDQQTQILPSEPSDQLRLAYAMNSTDWSSFQNRLEAVTQSVQQLFSGIFRNHSEADSQHIQTLSTLWLDGHSDHTTDRTLRHIGYTDPQKITLSLQALRNGSLYRNLDSRGRQRLDRLLPRLIESAATTSYPDSTLLRLIRLITAIGRRSVYFALLLEQPAALHRLCEICAASPWISNWIGQHPVVLDDLLRQAGVPEAGHVADYAHMSHLLSTKIATTETGDIETQMEIIREFRHSQVLLEAITALAGNRSPECTGQQLAAIAEAILCQCIPLAQQSLAHKLFPALGHNDQPPGLGIVAYGKLGGRELGYSSDLDIVFLYENQDGDASDETQVQYQFSRLVQRIIHLITMRTPGGQAYELDMRLRPSGNSGTLITSFHAFALYQQQQAWTWEHQALVRARLLGNNQVLSEHFETIRKTVLCQSREPEQLGEDICSMREQMRQHRDRSTADLFDLKHGSGGIVDIEFLVQYLVLVHAAKWPQIIIPRSTLELLDALASTGAIDVSLASNLRETYRNYLGLEQRLKLHEKPPVIKDPDLTQPRQQIVRAWRQLFGDR